MTPIQNKIPLDTQVLINSTLKKNDIENKKVTVLKKNMKLNN